jgi:hypothetical protein
LLFVEPQGSALCDGAGFAVEFALGDGDGLADDVAFADADGLADGDGFADGDGVAAAAALPEGMELAIASAAMGTSTMRFTCDCSPWERPARSDVRALGF